VPVLAGQVSDQAQLYGLLTRIRDLGLDLQSVTVLDASAESRLAQVRSKPRYLGTKAPMRGTKYR
jgi:hypothetical protein